MALRGFSDYLRCHQTRAFRLVSFVNPRMFVARRGCVCLYTMLTLSDRPSYHPRRTSHVHVTLPHILEGDCRNVSYVGITEQHASFLSSLNYASYSPAKIKNLGVHIPAAVCSFLRISLPGHYTAWYLDTFIVLPLCKYWYLTLRPMCR